MSNKAQKRGLIPKLRFPEFRDEGEWQSSPLEDLISTVTPPKKIQTSDYLSEGSFPIIDQGQSVIAGWTNDPDAIVEASQPLIVFGDHTCVLKLIRQSFAQGADGIKIIKGSDLADTAFLYQFLCFQPVVTEEYKRHFSILKTKVVAYPDRKSGEQQKIADCLASLDERITLEAQKLVTLKTHKKGLMQQLFPAEGKTLPKLRFAEFRDEGEWEEKSLGQIGEIVTGKTPSTSDDSLWNGDIQFVTPTDISEEKYQWKTQRSIVRNKKTKVLPKHSTMFTCIASIGKMSLSVKPCITNQQINTLIPDKCYDNEFVYYSLLSIVHLIKATQANSTLPIINKTEFSKFTVPVPKTYAEQQKIADCLVSLDELITAQTQKLAALKTHKKGLMQQLFPVLDEATQ